MRTRFFRSFSTELMKIAAGLTDADIRKLLADRNGEEYLVGGELPNNSANEYAPNTGPFTKRAFEGIGVASMDFKARKKDEGPYQHVRDWGWRGVQGAAAGAGLTKLIKDMKGQTMMPKDYRKGAIIGAGVALGDRIWRHRKEFHKNLPESAQKMEKDAGVVSPSPERVVATPRERLAASLKTGRPRGGVRMGRPPRGLRL